MVYRIEERFHSTKEVLIGFVMPVLIATSFLVIISWLTGEAPRWRWGRDDKNKSIKNI